MPYFNIVAQTTENTVVTEYEPVKTRSENYQSEAELEREFIRMLTEQGYEYLRIHTEAELLKNLRVRLSVLNKYEFSDSEWDRFLKESVANPNEHIVEKTRKIQEDYVQVLRRDDGTSKNILLIDKKKVHNNFLQVINQYAIGQDAGATHDNRYDVTVLVNGLPLVHIELKRRGVAIREAFNQINRYQRDSFWAGCGLFEYVQIFVISNGTKDEFISKVGVYGQMHYHYLKETRPSTLNVMRMKGTLRSYLEEVNADAEEMLDRLETEMAKNKGVTEVLKRQDQMAWVARKNNIRTRAMEIVQAEVIYL